MEIGELLFGKKEHRAQMERIKKYQEEKIRVISKIKPKKSEEKLWDFLESEN